MSNKRSWSTVKLFLTNKGCILNDVINVEKDDDLISNEKELVELFNQNYINIVENSSGKKRSSLGDCLNPYQGEITFKDIISVYSNHPSIQKKQSVFNTDSKNSFVKTNCKWYQQNN